MQGNPGYGSEKGRNKLSRGLAWPYVMKPYFGPDPNPNRLFMSAARRPFALS